ncbi:hypothetical protein GQ54DRAFT_245605, partial [Martensiomyces pterosporus]
SLLFRIISIIRIIGALTAPIQDCDEVYNYYEPLHFLQFGAGKQTWEYAPQFALRSYGFLNIYKWAVGLLHFVFGFRSKVQVFYALRILAALISGLCEAALVRAIATYVDKRIANYTALALFGMAGMYHSASALLPSTFAMYLGALGSAAAMIPPTIDGDHLYRRTVPAVVAFVAAAGCGWPYAAIVAVPFALEELLERGVSSGSGSAPSLWRVQRVVAMAVVGVLALAVVLGSLCLVDSWYYGRMVVAAWNQVSYNVFGGSGGPELYGTEPWHFYIKNGLVNANLVMVLGLLSLPLLAVEKLYTSHRLLLYRITPFYLAFLVFSLQPHKEERFMSIVYPNLCFNAAVSLSLLHPLRAWAASMLGGAKRGGQGKSDRLNMAILLAAGALGLLRMAALNRYYSAPVNAFMELPGHSPKASGGDRPLLPLGPVVCMGKDWYRFPSSYWLPEGYRLEFIQSRFDGHLPGSFAPVGTSGSARASTSMERTDFNGLNKWEPSHVVQSLERDCDFVVDVDFPDAQYDAEGGDIEMPFARRISKSDGSWKAVGCHDILDAQGSSALGRVLYVP